MATRGELFHDSMKLKKKNYKALLVFPKEDKQCNVFKLALSRCSIDHDVAQTLDQATTKFCDTSHHLVVVDCRKKLESFDGEAVCRSIQSSFTGKFTTMVALLRRRNQVEEMFTVREILNMGFQRILNETSNLDELEDEILQLEVGFLQRQNKFRSFEALCVALDHSQDSIQITDDKFQIKYINKTYRLLTGFTSKQAIDTNILDHVQPKKNGEKSWNLALQQIKRGEDWNGRLCMKQHTGDNLLLHIFILPLGGSKEMPASQYIFICRTSILNNQVVPDLAQWFSKEGHDSTKFGLHETNNYEKDDEDVLLPLETQKRNNSLAKVQSMAIEAPITQIINLLNAMRDPNMPNSNETLDQILEILRNSELYSPAEIPNSTQDPMLTDFVEGLVTGYGYRRVSGGENLLAKIPTHSLEKAHQIPISKIDVHLDPDIANCLTNCWSWDYDILALELVTKHRPLVHIGMAILESFKVREVLRCSGDTLHAWLVAIESRYHSINPYHNSTHAADVLQATAYFLRKEKLQMWMEPFDQVSALLAAIIHDVDHPGRTNAFLVNSSNPLALLYNDVAVLESHHSALAFKFTVDNPECNIFQNIPLEDFRVIRQSIIDMVLATELSKHFEHVNKFISIVTKGNNSSPFNETAGQNAAVTYELRTLIKRVMIKVADVINPARTNHICVEWARRISEEYFSQTDEEKRLGLPVVMPHFDRSTCSMPKSQTTFIDYFLIDMFDAWHEFCSMGEVMLNLYDNYNYWKRLQAKGVMSISELKNEESEGVAATPFSSRKSRPDDVNHLPKSTSHSRLSREEDRVIGDDAPPTDNHVAG